MQRVRAGARRCEDVGRGEDRDEGEGERGGMRGRQNHARLNLVRAASFKVFTLDDRENLSDVVNVGNQWCTAIHRLRSK
jgi:hypothetical protein